MHGVTCQCYCGGPPLCNTVSKWTNKVLLSIAPNLLVLSSSAAGSTSAMHCCITCSSLSHVECSPCVFNRVSPNWAAAILCLCIVHEKEICRVHVSTGCSYRATDLPKFDVTAHAILVLLLSSGCKSTSCAWPACGCDISARHSL